MSNLSRRIGKTTRIVDRCIQEFFTNGITYVYEGRDKKSQTDEAFERFKCRMEGEHFGVKYNFSFGVFDGIPCYKVEKHNL